MSHNGPRTYAIALLIASSAAVSHAQTFTILGNFDGANGAAPTSLIRGADGNLYGTTEGAGTNNLQLLGSVFKITPNGGLTNLYTFCPPVGTPPGTPPDCSEGVQPPGIILGTDGNFYGTTSGGTPGTKGYYGTIFKITPAGVLTTLHYSKSDSSEGQGPGSLTQASDGNFYGTRIFGGAYQSGTIFKMTPDGTLSVLYNFGSALNSGVRPESAMIQGTDGSLYGTTLYGGVHSPNGPNGPFNGGTMFKFTPGGALGGTLAQLYNFGAIATDGVVPFSPLVQATDGNFYGLTRSGGLNGTGSIFKSASDGTVTTVYSFSGSGVDGTGGGVGALIQATDGNFYGTTNGLGGVNLGGTVFKLTPDGAFSVLHSFSSTEGTYPNAILQGADGNLYGTASLGGQGGYGIVWKIDLSTVATISALSATSANAGGPAFTLIVTGSGFLTTSLVRWNGIPLATTFIDATHLTAVVPANLIAQAGAASLAVTNSGGASSNAVTFTINPPGATTLSITSLNPAFAAAGANAFTLTVNGSGFSSGSIVQWNGAAITTTFVNANQLTAAVPAALIASPGIAAVSVMNAGSASNSISFLITSSSPATVTVSALPHFAAQGPWTFGVFVINTGTQGANFGIEFHGDDGSPVALPFAAGSISNLSGTLPAMGSAYYEASNPAAALVEGWGQVTADPSIVIQALFREDASGTDYEAAVSSNTGSKEFVIPFDATSLAGTSVPLFTGFAIANLDPVNVATLSCTARDASGKTIPNAFTATTGPPALNPLGHWAGYLFPVLTGRRGVIDCISNTTVAATALRFIGSTAFSSLPVINK